MAFILANLHPTQVRTTLYYVSTDTTDEIAADGYFNGIEAYVPPRGYPPVAVDFLIRIHDADGVPPTRKITNLSPEPVTTEVA